MAENQNIEYKESWRTEYLKWLCGFANAHGGVIYVGVNDKEEVVGVPKAKKLMEDIPNQIQSGLGIMADVSLHKKNGKEFIAIKVEPSAFPVSYHGEFHYRSGSTKQLLTGNALSTFVMRKTGVNWEDATIEGISVYDLDSESFKIFRREALKSKRMTQEDLNISNEELLEKLHLMSDGKLKRSAVLLFHSDPSVIQVGSYVKIGRFSGDADLLYQDVLQDSLIKIADKVIDLIYLKYLKAKITYEHDRRVETYPYAREAIREAVYNAIAHNCYMFGTPIQIRIEDEAIIISNRCILPENWTVETLMEPHESIPYNENIANAFYYAGYIETWGRGIQKICNACTELGAEKPRYELKGSGLRVHFAALKSALFESDNTEFSDNYDGAKKTTLKTSLKTPLKTPLKILELIQNDNTVSTQEMARIIGINRRNITRNISKLQEKGIVSRVGSARSGHWEINEEFIKNPKLQAEVLGDVLDEKNDVLDGVLGEKIGVLEKNGVLEEGNDVLARKILDELDYNPMTTQVYLAQKLDLPFRTMQRKMNALQAAGIIERVGGKRFGHWKVNKK